MKKKLFLYFLVSTFSSFYSQSTLSIGSTQVVIDTVVTGLDVPWEIIYGPDSTIWTTERKGIVSRIDPVAKTKTVILDLSASVFAQYEAGMLGMAFHPDFATNKEVFLVYTYGTLNNIKERLVKYTYLNGTLQNQQILLDSIKGNVGHDGSRLLFMADKTLLMTTGEAHNGAQAQDLNSLGGKVLRLNSDGSIPANNPFPGKYVFTFGHRNAQGLCRGPGGNYYISEHGPTTDDEFQILEAGRNYGWPDVEGYCDLPGETAFCTANNVKEPLLDWTPTIAPSGMNFYFNPNFPEFHDRFILTGLKTKKLIAIKLNATGTASVSEASYLDNMFGRLRQVCVGPKAEIYIATNGVSESNPDAGTHNILVLRPPLPPPVSVSELNFVTKLDIYPTIVKDRFYIGLQGTIAKKHEVIITDATGRICKRESVHPPGAMINATELSVGIYFISVGDHGHMILRGKIIKE